MNWKTIFILLLLSLPGSSGVCNSEPDSGPAQIDYSSMDSRDLSAEFKTLGRIRGHFKGGAWDNRVDTWMGPKHRLMIRLQSFLAAGVSEQEVISLLGPPDLTAVRGDDLFLLVDRSKKFTMPASISYRLLIYYWRGKHDFLYFVCQQEDVLGSGWWYAGE